MAYLKHVHGKDGATVAPMDEDEAAELEAQRAADAAAPVAPGRNLVAELDQVKARLVTVESKG